MTYTVSTPESFWLFVLYHCYVAAEFDRPTQYTSRIDGLLLPWMP